MLRILLHYDAERDFFIFSLFSWHQLSTINCPPISSSIPQQDIGKYPLACGTMRRTRSAFVWISLKGALQAARITFSFSERSPIKREFPRRFDNVYTSRFFSLFLSRVTFLLRYPIKRRLSLKRILNVLVLIDARTSCIDSQNANVQYVLANENKDIGIRYLYQFH